MDISEYIQLLDGSFGTPGPEHETLSFGTMLAAANMCVKLTSKVSQRVSAAALAFVQIIYDVNKTVTCTCTYMCMYALI